MSEVALLISDAHPDDTPAKRVRFSDMPEAQRLARLEAVREARLKRYKTFKEHEEKRLAIKHDKVRAKMLKECTMLDKEFDKVDELINKIDNRLNKIRALEIEDEILLGA